jgi:RNA polymerase sigma-70 factor (ECF subfamily)
VREPPSDTELLNADGVAFAAFYRRYERLVLGWLIRATRDVEVAADLTADTFASAWVSRRSFRGDVAAPWLLGIAHNKLRMAARGRHRERAAIERLGILAVVVAPEQTRELERLFTDADVWLASLPEAHRAAVVARVLDDEEYAVIAERLGMPEPVIRQRVSRGVAALRRSLRTEGFKP